MTKTKKKRRHRGAMKPLSPEVAAYQPAHPGNPVDAVMSRLVGDGKLRLGRDERAYLADLMAEGLAGLAEETGMGAVVSLRLRNWVLGRTRT